MGVFKKFHYCFPCIELLLVAALLFTTATNSTAGLASVQALVCGRYAVVFWVLFVVVGLVIPTVLDTGRLFFSQGARGVPQGTHDRAAPTSAC